MFCKGTWRCYQKFRKSHRKTPVLESPFNKVTGMTACNFIKKRLQHKVFSCEICEIFKNNYFEEHLLTVASTPSRVPFKKWHGWTKNLVQCLTETNSTCTKNNPSLYGRFATGDVLLCWYHVREHGNGWTSYSSP